MKTKKIDELKPDPLSAARAGTDKATVTISGYVCAVDKTAISISQNRDGAFYIECPRAAVIAAFSDDKSEQVTLLVEANAQVKAISTMPAEMVAATQTREVGSSDFSTTCKSCDRDTGSYSDHEIMNRSGLTSQRLGLSDNFLRCYDICRSTGRGYYDCVRRCQIITRPQNYGIVSSARYY